MKKEETLQKSIIEMFITIFDKRVEWRASLEGIPLTRGAAAKAKALGMKSGWPDIELYFNGLSYFIELKRPKVKNLFETDYGGKLSETQKIKRDWLIENKFRYALCDTVDQVIAALNEWNIPHKATLI